MRKSKPTVCVVVPAYKEATVIKDVVAAAKKAFKKDSGYDYTILVINDGSPDATAAEAAKGGATVIDHILNSGAGGATATGLRYAFKNNYTYAATMDADGQHAPEDVIAGIHTITGSDTDLLIGSRLIDSTGMSKVKRLGNWGLSMVTYMLFRIKSTDSQSGLRIFSRKALQQLEWKARGYEFCSEMLWRAHQIGLNIDEYPIQAIYTEYSKGKGQSNWNALNIIRTLLARRLSELFR